MPKFKCKMMNLDQPSYNRTIYSREALENALENKSVVPVYLGNSMELGNLAGAAKLTANYPELLIDCSISETEAGKIANELLSKKQAKFALNGTCKKIPGENDTSIITTANISSINIISNPVTRAKLEDN